MIHALLLVAIPCLIICSFGLYAANRMGLLTKRTPDERMADEILRYEGSRPALRSPNRVRSVDYRKIRGQSADEAATLEFGELEAAVDKWAEEGL